MIKKETIKAFVPNANDVYQDFSLTPDISLPKSGCDKAFTLLHMNKVLRTTILGRLQDQWRKTRDQTLSGKPRGACIHLLS